MPIRFWPIPERALPGSLPERMDRPDVDPGRLARAFDALERLGRWSGEADIVVRALWRAMGRRPPGPLRLLDVGAGGGGTTARLCRRLRRGGWRPHPVLGDLHPTALRLARVRWRGSDGRDGTRGPEEAGPLPEKEPGPLPEKEPGEDRAPERTPPVPRPVLLRASQLPFADGSIDFAFSTTTLHHLGPEEAERLFLELERVSGGRWIVLDLRRSHATRWAVRLLASTLWRNNPLPRVDGPISVRRSFTVSELREGLDRSGPPGAVVRRRFPLRLEVLGRQAVPASVEDTVGGSPVSGKAP